MKIECSSGRGNFKLLKGSMEILELKYEKWYSSAASTRYRSREIRITPQGFWGNKFSINKNGKEIGDISINWRGQMFLRVENADGQENRYHLKAKSGWKLRFELYHERGDLLLTMSAGYNWRKFGYDFDIEETEHLNTEDHELLVYCGFAANLYVKRQGAG